uniref:Signal peptide peptidase SppA n=1 Tax=Leptospirillum ferriphilum TaxID=178606 RepID=A0A7C3QU90_9BACT
MKTVRVWLTRGLLVASFSLLLTSCISINLLPTERGLQEKVLSGEGAKDKLLLVPINGFIGDQTSRGLPFLGGREDTVTRIRATLRKASQDPKVRGIVLLIDSAGGSVTASDRVYHLIREFKRKSGIPVMAMVGDMGASGAYYVSVAADEVWVHPTSVVGSIGVVIFNVGVTGLMQKIGVEDRSLASGPEKEMGSPFKPMTDKDKSLFQGLISDLYAQFFDIVSRNRQIAPDVLKPLADGRIYTARQALKDHLVDRIGYRDDLIHHLKRLMHVQRFEVIRYREPFLASTGIFGSESSSGSPLADAGKVAGLLTKSGPTMLYLWSPGFSGSIK